MTTNGTRTKPSTEELIEDGDRYCIAGLPPHPVVASKALGAHIVSESNGIIQIGVLADDIQWDEDGNKYIDLIAAYSSANQGHSHPRIVAAMIDQCQKTMLPGYCVYNNQYPLLAKKMCEVRLPYTIPRIVVDANEYSFSVSRWQSRRTPAPKQLMCR